MRFKLALLLTCLLFSSLLANQDDFDFDDDEDQQALQDDFDHHETSDPVIYDGEFDHDEDDDGQVEDEEDDLVNVEKEDFDFGDPDQIIDTGDDSANSANNKRKFTEKPRSAPKLRMENVPSHLRENWTQYWIEGIALCMIVYYIINYFQGKAVNDAIAKAWMNENLEFLRSQFAEVGGAVTPEDTPTISSNSSNSYTLWCSGRRGCEGVLIELKLVARQDAVTVWKNKFNKKRPESIDFINITYYYDEESFLEPCILTVGQPRLVSELWKNFSDLRTFCPKGPKDKFDIHPDFYGCAENIEMLTQLFDTKAKATFPTNQDAALKLGYLHVSDKYESMYIDEDATRKSEMELRSKIFISSLVVDPDQVDNLNSESFTKGLLYMAERVARMKLSKEAKLACEKRRRKAIEDQQKKEHQIRHERAAERAEQKRRDLNRKIMDEEDPHKQAKMHEDLMAKDARKRNKKFKMKTK